MTTAYVPTDTEVLVFEKDLHEALAADFRMMLSPPPGNCATCRHWIPASERAGYGNVVSYDPKKYQEPFLREAHEATDAADRLFGQCKAITIQEDLEVGTPPPLAVTLDASHYEATLFTQAAFGCAMHEPMQDEQEGSTP